MRALVMKGECLELQQLENPKINDGEVLITIVDPGSIEGILRIQMGVGSPNHTAPAMNALVPSLQSEEISHNGMLGICNKVQVCAILDKGGYAEQVAVPAKQLLPIPSNVSFADAASLPFAACNVWLALFANLEREACRTNNVLIHEGASKIGSMAIQFAKYKGMKVIATAGNGKQLLLCEELGADACFNHKTQDLVDTVMKETLQSGVDLILDYGVSCLGQNLLCLKQGAKILIVDLQGEAKSTINLVDILTTNCELQVTDIRNESMDQKAFIIAQVRKLMWPAIEEGKVKPLVGRRLPLTAAGVSPKVFNDKIFNENKKVQNIILYP